MLGSDAYSYTLVPALMIWFGNESKAIDKWIFSRDFFFGWISTYMFYTFSQDEAAMGWLRPAIQLIPFLIYILVQGKDEDWKEKMRQLLGFEIDTEVFESHDVYRQKKRKDDV